jgi:hypothetical protein
MRTILVTLLIIGAARCERTTAPAAHIETSNSKQAHTASAALFTAQCARSRLAKWDIRADATGADCGVLLVETPIVLEDSMVEAMHFGTGAYDVFEGGVQHFSRDRAFRGVAYKDGSGRIWTYGSVAPAASRELRPCR